MCGCIFQKNGIVARIIRKRVVYRLIGMEVDIKDINDFNL